MRSGETSSVETKGIDFARLGDFYPTKDLWTRLSKNYARLEEERYWPANVFQRERAAEKWPGDIEGRTLLAWVLLERATGRPSRYRSEMLERWEEEVNERGYFGKDYGSNISEQQLSGHGWMLRALSELNRLDPEAGAATLAYPIIENLFLPISGSLAGYPIDPEGREAAGEYSGTHLKQVGRWILSTDVGCFAIGLAGLIDAWVEFGEPKTTDLGPEASASGPVRSLIDEMIGRFLEIDLPAIEAQTHATLSGLRSILKYADAADRPELVGEAQSRFDLYLDEAMTETYANFNWFNRPRWTEPCAVVDSIMVAMELWRTADGTERESNRYLEIAQLSYLNGLGHALRANGGFGCDNCVGADGETELFFKTRESHWCCTMRGSEGLARISQYQVAYDGERVLLPFGLPGEYRGPWGRFEVETDYPHGAEWTIRNHSDSALEIALFLPSWVEGEDAREDGRWHAVTLPAFGRQRFLGKLRERFRPARDTTARRAQELEDRRLWMRGPLVRAQYGEEWRPIMLDFERGDMSVESSSKQLLLV